MRHYLIQSMQTLTLMTQYSTEYLQETIQVGHNADSTALYKFKIINLTYVCVGTGTTSSNYPFTTFWMDGRTQMLYTAAELTAAGIGPNSAITKIGFNVLTADTTANERIQRKIPGNITDIVNRIRNNRNLVYRISAVHTQYREQVRRILLCKIIISGTAQAIC